MPCCTQFRAFARENIVPALNHEHRYLKAKVQHGEGAIVKLGVFDRNRTRSESFTSEEMRPRSSFNSKFVDFGRRRFIVEFVAEEKPSRLGQIKRLSLVVAFIIMTLVRWTVRMETFRNFSV